MDSRKQRGKKIFRSSKRMHALRNALKGGGRSAHEESPGENMRVMNYEYTIADIRQLILNCLDRDQRRRLILRERNWKSVPTRILVDFFLREYQLEKFGDSDIHDVLADTWEEDSEQGPQARLRKTKQKNVSRDEQEWRSEESEDILIRELNLQIRRMSMELKNEKHNAQVASEKYDLKLKELNSRYNENFEQWRLHAEGLNKTHKRAIESLEEEHRKAIQNWEHNVEVLVEEHEDEVKSKEQEIHKLRQEHDLLEAKLESTEDGHRLELERRENQWNEEIERLSARHEEEKKHIIEKNNEYVAKLDLLLEQKNQDIVDQQQKHDAEMARLKEKHQQALEASTAELRQKISSQNAILFARDSFTPISDRDLKAKFLALRFDVAHLARQPWKPDHPVWTRKVLTSITTNPDRTKEQLLRDKLWWILHDRIFCSPFRMFGEEGRKLEGDWIKACDEDPKLRTGDFTWPKPSYKAEKFRYEAIKQCHTALREPASHLDPRARVKIGFKESKDGLYKAIKTLMNDVTKLDEAMIADIEKLVKKAINMWLEFEVQRCRLMVILPVAKISSEREMIQLAVQKQLELNSQPGLIRFGDDEGEDLDVDQPVENCTEEKVLVS
ncbi:uncharacterized protein PV09_01460 [Verruconis gallopava]|uniref:Uncharacterized protein n=1 Tax=Verruconis gallopava TaxID=253628 RepID=A0A0D2AM19_9PEZI|nr:uncharacterized protein PV09_01460 [Verruconis gallopava]KIW07495.1 hypothetical protein PV09_01460 [Verruconis gallopava]